MHKSKTLFPSLCRSARETEGEMKSSDVDHGIPETHFPMENLFLQDEEIPDCLETEAPTSEKGGISWKKGSKKKRKWRRKKKGGVLLEGYVGEEEEENSNGHLQVLNAEKEEGSKGFSRTKSLTDDDLDELRGCLDLGFGFSYEEIPELCNTLPALELCYSISQRFMDEQQKSPAAADSLGSVSAIGSPIANWRISSPGDRPEEVKARLKYWAQAVACTVKLCS